MEVLIVETRKMHFRNDSGRLYATTSIPPQAVTDWTKEGATHVRYEYDPVTKILKMSPLKFEKA
jgi:hypothetical protein